MAPRLGRRVAGAALLGMAQAEILGVTLGARGVARDRGLAGLRIEHVARGARLARDERCVDRIVTKARFGSIDIELVGGRGVTLRAGSGHSERLLAVVATRAVLHRGPRQLALVLAGVRDLGVTGGALLAGAAAPRVGRVREDRGDGVLGR